MHFYNRLGRVSKKLHVNFSFKRFTRKLLKHFVKIVPFNSFCLQCLWDCFTESVRWPAGSYGIPKPASGCPWSDGFEWREGWRSQYTNGRPSNSTKSLEFHLDGIVDNTKVKKSFCIREDRADDGSRPAWPQG